MRIVTGEQHGGTCSHHHISDHANVCPCQQWSVTVHESLIGITTLVQGLLTRHNGASVTDGSITATIPIVASDAMTCQHSSFYLRDLPHVRRRVFPALSEPCPNTAPPSCAADP
eukprot:m.66991 g.66991  ORF g.66991 m.66991 type:complete len:114 (+) comp8401_c0_seq2:166-507(+)